MGAAIHAAAPRPHPVALMLTVIEGSSAFRGPASALLMAALPFECLTKAFDHRPGSLCNNYIRCARFFLAGHPMQCRSWRQRRVAAPGGLWTPSCHPTDGSPLLLGNAPSRWLHGWRLSVTDDA